MNTVLKQIKKTPVLFALLTLLIAPIVVNAYSEDEPSINEETSTTDHNQITAPLQLPTAEEPDADSTPAVTTIIETTETEQPIVEPENPDVIIDTDGVTLGEAQIIAQTEHSESAVKKIKTSVYEGAAVYVFYFEDGWKVSVRAIDGVVVNVKDPESKNHSCKNKLKNDGEFQNWLKNRKEGRRNRAADSQDVSRMRSNRDKRSHRDGLSDREEGRKNRDGRNFGHRSRRY